MPEDVLVAVNGPLAHITLNRPDKRNALTFNMLRMLQEILLDLEQRQEVRAVVLGGAGKAFCAGSDLKERQEIQRVLETEGGTDGFLAALRRVLTTIEGLSKPVIARIEGAAVGGGLELALACDFRVASEDARFGLPEVRIGSIAAGGGTQRLPRLIGLGPAMELVLTGRLISASEAQQVGLLHRLVSPDQVEATVRDLGEDLARSAPLSVQASKKAILLGLESGLDAGLDYESLANRFLSSTRDRAEGIQAFLEKRPPRFEGR